MGQWCVSAIRKHAKQGRIAMTATVTIQLRRSLLLVVALAASCAATAAEVSVLAAGAAKALLHSIEADFASMSGDRLQARFDTVGAQRERVERGERPDVVVLSQAAIAQLAKLDLIDRDSIRDIGDVQVGLAVAASAPAPAITNVESLRATLLAAKSIAYADPARGATAGAHFATVLQALGLREQLAARITVSPFGVDVIEAVAAGRFELGISQSSEIVQHAGVRYVGALPAPYGLATRYQAAALKGRTNGAALLRYLAGPAGQAASRKSGFAAP